MEVPVQRPLQVSNRCDIMVLLDKELSMGEDVTVDVTRYNAMKIKLSAQESEIEVLKKKRLGMLWVIRQKEAEIKALEEKLRRSK
jgi:hypothetical protein